MPRIDPEKLLKCIGVLLSPNGGIRSASEVKRLSGLMEKYCKKLVSKCIYIQILKCTETELLGEFMESGGWKMAHGWLSEGIDGKNWPLVQELLELLLLCPVDVPRLQSNDAPRMVKGLSREGAGTDGVRILAAKLVEQWLKVAKGEKTAEENQNVIVINKEFIQPNAQNSHLHNNKSLTYGVSDKMDMDEQLQLADTMNIADMIDNDGIDDDMDDVDADDVNDENSCNEGLVFKLTVKDGKQIIAKVNDSTSPKKLNHSRSNSNNNDKTIDSSDADESKMLKVSNGGTVDRKSKDQRLSDKSSSDRSKSKDRNRDKERKPTSSSSSSSHRMNSSSSSTKSSSSKHNSSSSSVNHSSSSSKSHKSSSGSGSKSSSSSSSSRDKSRDKHRSSSSKSSSSSHDKEKRDDKDKSKSDASKISQADKDKATLAKVLPPTMTKIGKIPKKTTSTVDEKSSSETNATDDDKKTIPPKKKSMSIEVRKDADRPKTVKTYNSQFRSHGLAEEAPPPPSRRDLKKSSSTTSSSTASLSSSPVPPKRSLSPTGMAMKEVEKKIKISSPTSEKPGAIKLIPAKPKPSVLVESDMFMDAIFSAATNKKDVRKRKRSESSSGTKESTAKPAGPMKFYQDTLDDSVSKDDRTKEDGVKVENDIDEHKIKSKKIKSEDDSNDDTETAKSDSDAKAADTEEETFEPVKREPGPGCGPEGPPGVLTLHRRKGPKKALRWRPQESLEEVRFFELDETERVNVTKTFIDAKASERGSEREAFLIGRKSDMEDMMVEQIPWAPLIEVEDVPEPMPIISKERDVQTEREKSCLKTIYFNRAMIPDSPSEPDVITYQNVEPTTIPFVDICNPDAVHDFTSMPWPEPKQSPQHNAMNMDEPMNGFGNFDQLGQMPFGNLNWPAGQAQMQQAQLQQQTMMNIRPPQMGAMINPMQFPRTMNATNFVPNGPPGAFVNNFNVPMQTMPRVNGPPNNWFGNMNGGAANNNNNNNWQTQSGGQQRTGNNNGGRSGWMQNRRLCKQFQKGYCHHGDSCKFLHPGVNCPPF